MLLQKYLLKEFACTNYMLDDIMNLTILYAITGVSIPIGL